MKDRPSVGMGVMVLKDGKVLLGKRLGKAGSYTWCLPGGHLENGETPEEGIIRETTEECGVVIENLRRGPYIYHQNERGNSYISLSFVADHAKNEPQAKEPDVISKWEWFAIDKLPKPMYSASKKVIYAAFLLSPDAKIIKPGIYRHYKGNCYRVIDVVKHTETDELLVLYYPLYRVPESTTLRVRPLNMFIESVLVNGKKQPRFTLIEEPM